MSEWQTDDGLEIVYDLLKQDETIRQYCYSDNDGLRIKFFEYPEPGDVKETFIVLESIINGKPSGYADDSWTTLDYLLHVEVWSRKRLDNRIVANRICNLLWKKLKFKQDDDVDEMDLGIYRDARRYKGILHRHDLDSL